MVSSKSFPFLYMIHFELVLCMGQGPWIIPALLHHWPGRCGEIRAHLQTTPGLGTSPLSPPNFTSIDFMSVVSVPPEKQYNQNCKHQQGESNRMKQKKPFVWSQDPGFESFFCHLQTGDPAPEFASRSLHLLTSQKT